MSKRSKKERQGIQEREREEHEIRGKSLIAELSKMNNKLAVLGRKIEEIHYMVDGQRAEMENHITSLEGKLNEALRILAAERAVTQEKSDQSDREGQG